MVRRKETDLRRFVVALVALILVFLVLSLFDQRSSRDEEPMVQEVTSQPAETVPPAKPPTGSKAVTSP